MLFYNNYMGGGALMQLVANGSQDIYLTGNPEMTYFRAVYRRHTNFAKESILQNTVGTLQQGSKFSVTIGRHGDLLNDIYVVIKRKTFEVPITDMLKIGFEDCSGNFYYPSAGYNFLEYVEVEIGGQVIDKHYGDWLNIWTDLTEPNDKKMLLNQMLYGKTRLFSRKADIFKDGDIYLPLKFWFCNNPGLALPLIALQYHEVKLNFSLTPSCFSANSTVYFNGPSGAHRGGTASASSTVETTVDVSGHSHPMEVKYPLTIPLSTNIIDELSVYADYIFLDTAERRKFAKVKHEYLFEQIQTQGPTSILPTADKETVDLRFNHPIKEVVWTLDDAAPSICAPACNTKKYEIIKAGLLQLNGKDRFQKRNGSYFTLAQRYQHHSGSPLKYLFEALYSGDLRGFKKNWGEFTGSRIPSEAIHLYSFALHPEKNIPSGSCNFSRLDNVVLELDFFTGQGSNPCLGSSRPCYYDAPNKRTLWVYGINYNILRIMGGMGGLVYCN